MRTDWEPKKLGDVCDFKGGGTPSKANESFWRGDIPWVSPKDMKVQEVVDSIDHITSEAIMASATAMISAGSVLMVVRSGILARTVPIAVTGRSLTINQDLKALCPRPEIDSWFLYYLLASKMPELLGLVSRGATVHRLSTDQIRSIEFLLPPRLEQERIVTILDYAFEGIANVIANTEKNLQNARDLFDRELHKVFTERSAAWTTCTLADVCEIRSKLVDPREPEYLDLPHIGAGNIESKTGEVSNVMTAREEKLISGKFLFDDSMVLYSKIRPYLMKVVRPDLSGLCSADVYPLGPVVGKTTRDYLFYLLLTPVFTEYAIKGSARAGMPKVNRDHLFAFELSIPPVEEQVRLTAKLDALSEESQRLIAVYSRKLAALDEFKQSLLRQALSGELTSTQMSEEMEAVA